MLRSATDALAVAVLRVCVRLPVERGQTLAEYGVIVSVLTVFVVVVAVVGFGDAVTSVFSNMVSCLSGTCGP